VTVALLVMDFQNAIVGMLEDADGLLERAERALAVARSRALTIAYVRVALTDEDRVAAPARFARLRDGDPATAIVDRLAPADGDIVVRKVRIGAFSTTDLEAQLRARGISELVLTGISTSGVVLSTVRDAFDKDFRLTVLSDVCGDPDEEVHRVLMEKVFPRQAEVVELAAWSSA
jgi:nicotinamidase-related amidase